MFFARCGVAIMLGNQRLLLCRGVQGGPGGLSPRCAHEFGSHAFQNVPEADLPVLRHWVKWYGKLVKELIWWVQQVQGALDQGSDRAVRVDALGSLDRRIRVQERGFGKVEQQHSAALRSCTGLGLGDERVRIANIDPRGAVSLPSLCLYLLCHRPGAVVCLAHEKSHRKSHRLVEAEDPKLTSHLETHR
eukprot:1233877-Rhodomonas_salina.3